MRLVFASTTGVAWVQFLWHLVTNNARQLISAQPPSFAVVGASITHYTKNMIFLTLLRRVVTIRFDTFGIKALHSKRRLYQKQLAISNQDFSGSSMLYRLSLANRCFHTNIHSTVCFLASSMILMALGSWATSFHIGMQEQLQKTFILS